MSSQAMVVVVLLTPALSTTSPYNSLPVMCNLAPYNNKKSMNKQDKRLAFIIPYVHYYRQTPSAQA